MSFSRLVPAFQPNICRHFQIQATVQRQLLLSPRFKPSNHQVVFQRRAFSVNTDLFAKGFESLKGKISEYREYMFREAPLAFREEILKQGPVSTVKWLFLTVIVGLLYDQYETQTREFDACKKRIEEIGDTVKDSFFTIKGLGTFSRMYLFSNDFDPNKVQNDISKIELTIQEINDLQKGYLKAGGYRTIYRKSREAFEKKIIQEKVILEISLSLLKSLMLYHSREFYKAKQELENGLNSYKAHEKYLREGVTEWKARDQERFNDIIFNIYNVYGLILRANAKMHQRDQDFESAMNAFLDGLERALPEQERDPGKKGLDRLNDRLNILLVKLATSEIDEKKPFYVPFLNNLGFLLNQWNKNEDALRCHKIAYDLAPKNVAVVNGLAYGLVQKGLFADDAWMKNMCYAEAEKLYKIALALSPNGYNYIVMSNQAQLYLEIAEEAKDKAAQINREDPIRAENELEELNKKKISYYDKARNKLEAVIQEQEQKGTLGQHRCLMYAVALSNIGHENKNHVDPDEQKKAKKIIEDAKTYLEKATILKPNDLRIQPYVDALLKKDVAYPLPPVDGNRTLRKNYQNMARKISLEKVKVEFSDNDVLATRIETDRTIIRPIQKDDLIFLWEELYGHRETMRFYDDRVPRTFTRINSFYIETWEAVFKSGSPYGGYVVVSKEDPSQRIGMIAIEASENHDARPGVAQLFWMFAPYFRGNFYGPETLSAFTHYFVKARLANNPKFLVQGQELKEIEMTAININKPSINIIKNYIRAQFIDIKDDNNKDAQTVRNVYRVNCRASP